MITAPLKKLIIAVLSGVLLFAVGNIASAATDEIDAASNEVTPPRVYQEAQIFRAEVERIRQYLGVRAPRERSYKLDDAQPRQTFYQSQTLFRKSNQLAKEIAGVSRQRPEPAPDREVVPGDVLQMLQAARGQIDYVKAELGIDEEFPTPKLESRRTVSNVMREIIESGYTLNELVEEGAQWSDIYDRVLQMIAYAGGSLPEDKRYPALAPNACCKMPQDVYQSLGGSMVALKPLAKSVDYALVRITIKKAAEGGAGADTVYDLTTIMVSDIGEITLRLGADDTADQPEYPRPKRILPSDVYRLAQVLAKQVEELTAQQ